MNTQNKHSWIGIILVALGGLLIVDNFGIFYFDIRHLIFSWHTIMLIIGIIILSNSKSSIAGIIFVIIGLWGYATHLFPWFTDFAFGDLWPILLIIVGLSLLLKKKNGDHRRHDVNESFPSDFIKSSTTSESSNDTIDEVAIFTAIRRNILSQNFHGGKITSIFGGVHLDFSRAKMAAGENHLEIACIFGGCKIYVPREWKVIVNVTSVFGGIDDKRFVVFEVPTSDGVLVIKGAVIFGGAEILSI
jgi:predicted membrane protein